MCGISGIFCNFRNSDILIVHRMASTMYHRGPDHTGFFTDDFVALAHNRLNILDLSAKAPQPMLSQCKRYVIIYNGEVYNFRELQKKYNLPLEFTTDTEVILQLYILLGDEFVHQLNGVFAIAIYDKEKFNLSLFRDRLGAKPLFYAHSKDFFVFASELKAIIALPEIARNLTMNRSALFRYFHVGYIPAPETIYKGIFKLEAGSYLKVSIDDFQTYRWWKVDDSKIFSTTLKDENLAIREFEKLLEDSVRQRLTGDVPVGCLLSGGIDSTLVTLFAARQSSQKLDTFCVRFDCDTYDESPWAAKIAQYIGTNHHEMTVSATDVQSLLPSAILHYDEPYGDSSALPTMLGSKIASNYVKAVLLGDGGDELFHGYGAYRWAQRLSNIVLSNLSPLLSFALYSFGNDRMKRISHLFDPYESIYTHIFSQEQYLFTGAETLELLNFDYPDFWNFSFKSRNRKLTPAERQAIFDIYYYLPDDLLVKTDRGCMYYSLENRAPLLDDRIVEWSLNLDPGLKIKNGTGKYLLRKVLEKNIPPELFNRPKRGFAIPLKVWMKEDLKDTFMEYLSPSLIQKYNIVDSKVVERLKTKFYNKNHDYLYNRLWLVAALHIWLEQSPFRK